MKLETLWFYKKNMYRTSINGITIQLIMALWNEHKKCMIMIPEFRYNIFGEIICRRDEKEHKVPVLPKKELIDIQVESCKNTAGEDGEYLYICRRKDDKFAVGIVASKYPLRMFKNEDVETYKKL